jgi:hypothetical protein
MMEPSERLEENTLQIRLPAAPTINVFCTGKIYGGQDHVFMFRGGPVNYKELQSTL